MGKHPGGRPSKYSEDLAERICELIVQGKTLVAIADTEGFPSRATLCRWLSDPSFEAKCTRARLMQAELMDQMILDVADSVTDKDSAYAAKVKISAYQWRASKLAPKRFGDKIQQEHSGELNVSLAEIVAKVRKRSE